MAGELLQEPEREGRRGEEEERFGTGYGRHKVMAPHSISCGIARAYAY